MGGQGLHIAAVICLVRWDDGDDGRIAAQFIAPKLVVACGMGSVDGLDMAVHIASVITHRWLIMDITF